MLVSLFFSFATNDGFDLGFQHLIALTKFTDNDQPRTKYFLKDQIPSYFVAVDGYVALASVSVATWSLASTYEKLALFFLLFSLVHSESDL